jgi:hypothetical protein
MITYSHLDNFMSGEAFSRLEAGLEGTQDLLLQQFS